MRGMLYYVLDGSKQALFSVEKHLCQISVPDVKIFIKGSVFDTSLSTSMLSGIYSSFHERFTILSLHSVPAFYFFKALENRRFHWNDMYKGRFQSIRYI